MHELLVSRGFVRRADAPDLAEVKEREAVAAAEAAEAAAIRKKERAEAAAKRKLDKETNRKVDEERTKVLLFVFYILCCKLNISSFGFVSLGHDAMPILRTNIYLR